MQVFVMYQFSAGMHVL